jgi:hypothetical protein
VCFFYHLLHRKCSVQALLSAQVLHMRVCSLGPPSNCVSCVARCWRLFVPAHTPPCSLFGCCSQASASAHTACVLWCAVPAGLCAAVDENFNIAVLQPVLCRTVLCVLCSGNGVLSCGLCALLDSCRTASSQQAIDSCLAVCGWGLWFAAVPCPDCTLGTRKAGTSTLV